MSKGLLPEAAMERVLKKAGSKRVSSDAKQTLRETLEEKAMIICDKAIKFAQHSGRKTIKAEDIKLAVK